MIYHNAEFHIHICSEQLPNRKLNTDLISREGHVVVLRYTEQVRKVICLYFKDPQPHNISRSSEGALVVLLMLLPPQKFVRPRFGVLMTGV